MALSLSRLAAEAGNEFGLGGLGDVTISSATDADGDREYNTLTIQTGFSLAATAEKKLIVRTVDGLTIEGTGLLFATGRGYAGTAGGQGGETQGTPFNGLPGTGAATPSGGPGIHSAAGSGGGGGSGGGANGGDSSGAGAAGGAGSSRSSDFDASGLGAAGVGGAPVSSAVGLPGTSNPSSSFSTDVKTSWLTGGVIQEKVYSGSPGAGGGGGGGGNPNVGGGGNPQGAGGAPGSQTGAGQGDGGAGPIGLGNGQASGGSNGGSGGGGGAGGGSLEVFCGGTLTISASGSIEADGGAGGSGGGSQTGGSFSATGGSAGGGSPGGGGAVRVVYVTDGGNIDAAHIHADAGVAGVSAAPGVQGFTGGQGANGGVSEDGWVFIQQVRA